jgi:predicted membrane chloride channel (bestrophin family)
MNVPEKKEKQLEEMFESIRRSQLQQLDELEEEVEALTKWISEFKKLLNETNSMEEVVVWSMQNDIESTLKHIKLF